MALFKKNKPGLPGPGPPPVGVEAMMTTFREGSDLVFRKPVGYHPEAKKRFLRSMLIWGFFSLYLIWPKFLGNAEDAPTSWSSLLLYGLFLGIWYWFEFRGALWYLKGSEIIRFTSDKLIVSRELFGQSVGRKRKYSLDKIRQFKVWPWRGSQGSIVPVKTSDQVPDGMLAFIYGDSHVGIGNALTQDEARRLEQEVRRLDLLPEDPEEEPQTGFGGIDRTAGGQIVYGKSLMAGDLFHRGRKERRKDHT